MIGLVGRPACFAVVTFNQTAINYSGLSLLLRHAGVQSAQLIFSSMLQTQTLRDSSSDIVLGEWEARLARAEFPDPPHRRQPLRKHRSFIGAFYTSAPDVCEEGSGFQRDSTPDVLFIQVEEIRRFSCHQSPLNGKYLYLSEPADLQGIRLVFVCNS